MVQSLEINESQMARLAEHAGNGASPKQDLKLYIRDVHGGKAQFIFDALCDPPSGASYMDFTLSLVARCEGKNVNVTLHFDDDDHLAVLEDCIKQIRRPRVSAVTSE
jgi:hypothetical protein